MKKLKIMMKGLWRKHFELKNGKRTIVKELAHSIDENLNEHYCFIYKVEEIIDGKYNEYYL